jgi:lysophospholipase L1-like esterase
MRWAILLGLSLAGLCAFEQSSEATREQLQHMLNEQRHVLADWAGLNHYGSDDSEVKPPKPGEERVVFLGDEVTENWSPFFPGKPYINRGIAHQITPQLLVRFRQDVIALKPRVVVIQAGGNDVAGRMGGGTEEMMADQVTSMVELAKVNGIRVVLASLTPVCDCYGKQMRRRQPGRLTAMNDWLKEYAEKSGCVYVDYYSALSTGGEMKKEYTDDGVLPNEKGYAVMAPLTEKAISKVLAQPAQVKSERKPQ